jgi:hypothetical protein
VSKFRPTSAFGKKRSKASGGKRRKGSSGNKGNVWARYASGGSGKGKGFHIPD